MSERQTSITWEDPAVGQAVMPTMTGIDYLRAMQHGEVPAAPIVHHFDMSLLEVEEGSVTFQCQPNESHYNPIGMVHGGVVCTLLDSALGCAGHTLVPVGVGYTSIEIKVSYLRPVSADSGPLVCTGRVTKPGQRVMFAEGEVVDRHGKTVATASGTLLVLPLPTA